MPLRRSQRATPIQKSLGRCPEAGQNQPSTATRLGFRHAFSRWQETEKQQVEGRPKKRTKCQQKAQSDSRSHGEGSPHRPSCKAWAEPSRQASGAEWESTDSPRGHLHSGRNTPVWGVPGVKLCLVRQTFQPPRPQVQVGSRAVCAPEAAALQASPCTQALRNNTGF